MLPTVDKNRPNAAWIAALRQAFPCEPEVDRFLTRKMARRSGPGYTPVTLSSLCEGIEALLRAQLDHAFAISEPRWLTGGASKLQMAFKLAWCPDGKMRVTTPMVLRMQPAESIVESSRRREFQLINALQGRVAVPPVYWLDNEGDYLPYPALIYGLMAGVTKPTRGVGGAVSGMGTNYGARLRALLAPQFVRDLALIHTRPWADAELDAFEMPPPGPLAVTRQLNWWARVWQEDSVADIPLLTLADLWLREHLPPVDRVSLLHGDFRCGNFLFDEDDGQITAWLDWELGHMGDRHEDLAWVTNRAWGHPADDGSGYLVCGLLPEAAFLAAYEHASGLPVNLATLRYYKVLNTYKTAIMSLATGYRIALGGKTHQDVLVAWCVGIGAKFMEELHTTLEESA